MLCPAKVGQKQVLHFFAKTFPTFFSFLFYLYKPIYLPLGGPHKNGASEIENWGVYAKSQTKSLLILGAFLVPSRRASYWTSSFKVSIKWNIKIKPTTISMPGLNSKLLVMEIHYKQNIFR